MCASSSSVSAARRNEAWLEAAGAADGTAASGASALAAARATAGGAGPPPGVATAIRPSRRMLEIQTDCWTSMALASAAAWRSWSVTMAMRGAPPRPPSP
jgi:hypothetical protein